MFSGSAHSPQPSLDDICSDIARLLFFGVCILFLCHFSKMTLAVLPFTVTWPILFFLHSDTHFHMFLSLIFFWTVTMWWLYNPKCPCAMTSDGDYGRHFTRDHPWCASHVFRDTTSVLCCCKIYRRRRCSSLYPLSPVLSSRSVVCSVRVTLKHGENVSRFISRTADDSNLLLTGLH